MMRDDPPTSFKIDQSLKNHTLLSAHISCRANDIMIQNPGKDRIVVIELVRLEPNGKSVTGYNHGVVHPKSPALSWVLNRHTILK
jgi:hypothetical protein